MVTVFIPSPLRKFTGGSSSVSLDGQSVQEVIDNLLTCFPDLKPHLLDENQSIRNFINLYLNQTDIRTLDGLKTAVSDNADLRIIPAIAGGSSKLQDLSSPELSRYARHFSLPEFGEDGQKKLKASSILIVGAGGLGSPVSLYLAAAGVGHLGIIDMDVVDESNLQRQILFSVKEVGQKKAERAKSRLNALNPHTEITVYDEKLTSANAMEIIAQYDIVIDGTDNFPTRYLVNDACVILGKPNIYGSIFRFDGQASVFHYQDGPCYRCLYPEPPPPGLVPSCSEGGVLGVLPGIVGCIQANEAIKILTGIGKTLKGRLLLFDALNMEFNELNLNRNTECKVCGDTPSVTELIDYNGFCGLNIQEDNLNYNEITVQELKSRMDNEPDLQILDVREPFEVAIAAIDGTMKIPMNSVPERINELDPDKELIIHCKSGVRSAKVCDYLSENNFKNLVNVKGGIKAWAQEIDSSVPVY